MQQKPKQKRQTTFTDHKGNTFKTLDEMCQAYGITRSINNEYNLRKELSNE